jgi:hypothetical protein
MGPNIYPGAQAGCLVTLVEGTLPRGVPGNRLQDFRPYKFFPGFVHVRPLKLPYLGR